MEIRDLISTMNYTLNDLHSKRTNDKKQEVFSGLMAENEALPEDTHEDSPAVGSMIADNSVKSTLMLGRLASQGTGASSIVKLPEEVNTAWDNGIPPEGLRFVNADGVVFSGGTKKYDDYFNVYYTDGAEHDYQFAALYDENSAEDNPIMYLRISEWGSSSVFRGLKRDEVIKVEVNKVDPSNATYEEMIALAGYIYRDDPKGASEACDAIDMARFYMEADGLDWQNGSHDYMSYYLPEVVRRNKDYPNPANQVIAEAAEDLLEYLKDYPRGAQQ